MCVHACLATCGFTCDVERLQQEQRERHRARYPSSRRRCCGRCAPAQTKPRSILQQCTRFARDLQRGVGLTCLHSRLHQRTAWHAIPRRGARLRAAYAPIFGKAYAFTPKCLSADATRPCSIRLSGLCVLFKAQRWSRCDSVEF